MVAGFVTAVDHWTGFPTQEDSVPFRVIGQTVEIRGSAGGVQILKTCDVLALHPRGPDARLVIDQAHDDGPSDDRVIAPPPLGR